MKHVSKLRQGSLAFCEEERGLLKLPYGKTHIVPVIKHELEQQRPITILAEIKNDFIEIVRERVKTGL